MPSRTLKEYYEGNIDQYSQANKKYYELNKDAILKRQRKHRSEKVECLICDKTFKKGTLWSHNKSQRHLTALAKLSCGSESGPQYEQQLNELLNAHKMTCDLCNKTFMKGLLTRHSKSKYHLTALAKLNQTFSPPQAEL